MDSNVAVIFRAVRSGDVVEESKFPARLSFNSVVCFAICMVLRGRWMLISA